MKSVITFIPAIDATEDRFNKSLRIIDGKTLIDYQIEEALKSKHIKKILVITNNEKVKDHIDSTKIAAGILFKNITPMELRKLVDVYYTFIKVTKLSPDLIVSLMPNLPLNQHKYIDYCLEKAQISKTHIYTVIEQYSKTTNEKELSTKDLKKHSSPFSLTTNNCRIINLNTFKENPDSIITDFETIPVNEWDALEVNNEIDLKNIRKIVEIRNREEKRNYFRKRIPPKKIRYEKEYWGETIDPDGIKRNKLEEKDQYIEDCKEIISYVNSLPPGKILDIGCGFGFLLSAINDKWEKHGTELSKYSSETAGQYAKIFTGNLLNSNYEKEYFDVIILNHVIEHLDNPIAYITKISNLLNIGGKLIIATPDFECITAQRFKDNFRLLHDKTHVSLFSTESLKELLEDSGFEIEKIEYPFFETRYFNKENLLKTFETDKISPPFYGNVVILFTHKC